MAGAASAFPTPPPPRGAADPLEVARPPAAGGPPGANPRRARAAEGGARKNVHEDVIVDVDREAPPVRKGAKTPAPNTPYPVPRTPYPVLPVCIARALPAATGRGWSSRRRLHLDGSGPRQDSGNASGFLWGAGLVTGANCSGARGRTPVFRRSRESGGDGAVEEMQRRRHCIVRPEWQMCLYSDSVRLWYMCASATIQFRSPLHTQGA